MDAERSKKLRAAISAVTYYLQQEESEKEIQPKYWQRSGREQTMNNRYLVQMRDFRR